MKIKQFTAMQIEDMEEQLPGLLAKLLPGSTKEAQRDWWEAHQEDVTDEMLSHFSAAIQTVRNQETGAHRVTKPVLEFKMKTGERRRVWALDAGEVASLADHRSFWFGGSYTAGLIYEDLHTNGHSATESNLRDEKTWGWIQQWMEEGFKSKGLL